MAEKLKLDLSLVLPDVPDERDACVGRLTELLQAEGLEKGTGFTRKAGTRLCLALRSERFSVSRVRELAQAAQAKLDNRYRHASSTVAVVVNALRLLGYTENNKMTVYVFAQCNQPYKIP